MITRITEHPTKDERSLQMPHPDITAEAHTSPLHAGNMGQHTSPIIHLPDEATFKIWLSNQDRSRVTPEEGPHLHISEIIPGDGNVVLVCFSNDMLIPSMWQEANKVMSEPVKIVVNHDVKLTSMAVGGVGREIAASAIHGMDSLCGQHPFREEHGRRAIFVPSTELGQALGITRHRRPVNALVLIQNGHITAKWVAPEQDASTPHDWTLIHRALGITDDEG